MHTTVPIDRISFHRLLVGQPGLMAPDSPEFAALVDDIEERGIDQPLFVTETQDGGGTPPQLYLIDGRNRFLAAKQTTHNEVPVIIREESEAPQIILATLVQRRHYGKGALAYLAFPLLTALRSGRGGDRRSKSTQSTLISAEELALRAGFSRDLFFQAQKVHEAFDRRPDLRERFEARILAGEIGLGACVAGLASSEATTGTERQDRSPFTLIKSTFEQLRGRVVRGWEKLDRSVQVAIAEEATETVLAMPPEVQAAITKALAAGKGGRAA